MKWVFLISAETVNLISNNPNRLGISEQSFELYLRMIRKQLATVKGDDFLMRPLDLPVEIAAKRFVWSPATDPTRGKLMDAIVRATEEEVYQQPNTISPNLLGRQSLTSVFSDHPLVWFIRYQILFESFSDIAKTANKYFQDVSADHLPRLDRGTVARGVRHVAEVLGVALRPPDHGGRPDQGQTAKLSVAL